MIMPMSDRAFKYIDKFGSERLRYQTLSEAVGHYRQLKRILVPDIGIAKVTCYSGQELNKLINTEGIGSIPDYRDDSQTEDTDKEITIDDLRVIEVNGDDY